MFNEALQAGDIGSINKDTEYELPRTRENKFGEHIEEEFYETVFKGSLTEMLGLASDEITRTRAGFAWLKP